MEDPHGDVYASAVEFAMVFAVFLRLHVLALDRIEVTETVETKVTKVRNRGLKTVS